MYRVTKRQSTDSHIRMWSAKVVMALVTIIRKAGIMPLNHYDNIQVMLSYLYLEKDVCEHVVSQMVVPVRSVYVC